MTGAREGRRSQNLEVTGEGKARKTFLYAGMDTGDALVGGLYRAKTGRTSIAGEAGQEWAAPPPDGHWTVVGEDGVGSISKLSNNKRRSLGLEWSMSGVGKLPPHNPEKSHRLVASKTHTKVGQY